MRVLFRTKIFYHSTSIFAIVPSVTLDGPQSIHPLTNEMAEFILPKTRRECLSEEIHLFK